MTRQPMSSGNNLYCTDCHRIIPPGAACDCKSVKSGMIQVNASSSEAFNASLESAFKPVLYGTDTTDNHSTPSLNNSAQSTDDNERLGRIVARHIQDLTWEAMTPTIKQQCIKAAVEVRKAAIEWSVCPIPPQPMQSHD